MRKSTMFRMTMALGAMFVGAVALAQMGGGGAEEEPPLWTIVNPEDADTFASPLTSIGVGGGHSPEGVSAYVCKIRREGFNTVTGSVGGSCNQDGSWANTISFNSSPTPDNYNVSVYPSDSPEPDQTVQIGILDP